MRSPSVLRGARLAEERAALIAETKHDSSVASAAEGGRRCSGAEDSIRRLAGHLVLIRRLEGRLGVLIRRLEGRLGGPPPPWRRSSGCRRTGRTSGLASIGGLAAFRKPRTSFGSPLLHRPRPGEAHTSICTKIRKGRPTTGGPGKACGATPCPPRFPVPAKPGREAGETREMLGSGQRRQQFLRPGNPTVMSGCL
jgi:hypothetical protein